MTPRIYLIGRPTFDPRYQDFLNDFLATEDASWKTTNTATPAERLVEFAGRVCYMSFGSRQSARTNAEYISNLILNGHESVLEHAVWSFVISGISRSFTHQLVRHRVGFSFSQLSQQYHDESEARFVRPVQLNAVPEAAAIWDKAIGETRTAYIKVLRMLETASHALSGQSRREAMRALRSVARSVLPNATETAIVVTANARALRHFFKIRGDIVGDVEMRCVAATLLELLRPEGPALFSDFRVEQFADGLPLVSHRPIEPKK
jgi:thymidylate synthase (FAD)